MSRILALIAALSVTSPVLAADQFDLQCEGTIKLSPIGRAEPYKKRYTVDLAQNLWCASEHIYGRDFNCPNVLKIADVTPDQITFQDSTDRMGRHIEWVSRRDGTYEKFSTVSGFWSEKGQCEVTEFSGFPATRF